MNDYSIIRRAALLEAAEFVHEFVEYGDLPDFEAGVSRGFSMARELVLALANDDSRRIRETTAKTLLEFSKHSCDQCATSEVFVESETAAKSLRAQGDLNSRHAD